jgi:Flp pilus assembly protein TadG
VKRFLPSRRRRGIFGRNDGAVIVEHTVAIVPLLITFFSLIQVTKLHTVDLALRYAAISSARAAIVISNEHDDNPGTQGDKPRNLQDINLAAEVALLPWIESGAISDVKVEVQDRSSRSDPNGPVTVKVTARYACQVPLGKLVCLPSYPEKIGKHDGPIYVVRRAEATLPHQGARYREADQ